jgi:hypothetical protein
LFAATSANQMSGNLSCSSSGFTGTSDPALPPLAAFSNDGFNNLAYRPSFNFSTWCPPSDGSYLRNGQTLNVTAGQTPGNNINAWTAQPSQNIEIDGSKGMTTGWMGGLLAPNVTGQFTQIGDLSQTRLLKLMWLTTMESGRAQGPLRTDGIFYSPQAIFGLVRSRLGWSQGPNTTSAQGRWVHNGSIISYELGFLAPGPLGDIEFPAGFSVGFTVSTNKAIDFAASPADGSSPGTVGPGMGLYYDKRMAGFLNVGSGASVKIKPVGGYALAER